MAKTSTFTRFIYVYLLFLLAGLGAIVRIILVQVNKDRVTLDDIYKEQVLEPSRAQDRLPVPLPVGHVPGQVGTGLQE